MSEENSFTDEDLSRIRQKAFSSELKGLISKVTREVHSDDTVNESDPLYSASNLFYRALNRPYLNSDFIESREFCFFSSESVQPAEVYCYNCDKSLYSSNSTKSIIPTKDFFRKLRKKMPFEYPFSGSLLRIFPFSAFTDIFDNECFPPFVVSPGGDFNKLASIDVLMKKLKTMDNNPDFMSLGKMMIQLSEYFDRVFLISLSSSEKLPESLFLLSRIKSIIKLQCPEVEIIISSQRKMLLFADTASTEKALSLAVENENVAFEEIKNVRNDIFSMFG